MSDIEDKVAEKIKQRGKVGEKKYGVSMADEHRLSFNEWLTHLQEELMDASVYLEKLMEMMEEKKNGE